MSTLDALLWKRTLMTMYLFGISSKPEIVFIQWAALRFSKMTENGWAHLGRERSGFCSPGGIGFQVITSKITLIPFLCNYNIFHFLGDLSIESKRLIFFHGNKAVKLLEISTD